jgi:MFS family permease
MSRRSTAGNAYAFRILFVCLVCIGMGQAMLFAILPPAARQIGISPFEVSTIFATSATIWVFVSPMWGRRSDVTGRRPVILIGLLGFSLSMILLATVIEIGLWQLLPAMAVYPLMIAARSVFALLGSGTGPASQAYVADRTSISERTAGVALMSAAMGLGQTVGPGLGAALAVVGVLAPIYFAAVLAIISALLIWRLLPEDGPPIASDAARPPRMSPRDARVLPFLILAASLQAVRSTTVITLAFFLQDTLKLTAKGTVQYAGIAFMVLAVAGLFAQLVLVQRFRPPATFMIQSGVPLILIAFVLLAFRPGFAVDLIALTSLGVGLGLVRPGNAAGASLAVRPNEQGSVAGLTSGIAVIGNIFGPLLGAALYERVAIGPYLLNGALMACMLVFVFTNRRLRHIP